MKSIVDLHIHSKYARACSKDLSLENLEKWSRIKGTTLIGTGDFQHPKWNQEIKGKLVPEDGTGILRSKTGFPFICTSEIALMYTQGGKGRRIHFLLFAPNLDVVDQITDRLLKKGRLDYDGRPIFGFSAIELVDMMSSVSPDIEIVPAHCMTPWFGNFGEKSGFDSLEECFQEKAKHIHAVETGLSADPQMLWRLPFLDKIQLVSFSDLHSYWPWRLGREATILDIKDLTYQNILKSIRTGEGLAGTYECSPSYGKYHVDGHRLCGISLDPADSKKLNEICPKCNRKLTVGVLSRIEELAQRPENYKPENRPDFKSIIPLSEIICFSSGSVNPASRPTWEIYNKLIQAFGSELNVSLEAKFGDLEKIVDSKLAENIIKVREGKVKILPGFDGVYGIPIFDPANEEKLNTTRLKVAMTQMPEKEKTAKQDKKQKSLTDFK